MVEPRLPKTQRAEIAVIRRQLRAIDRLAEEMMLRGHEIHRRLWAMENGPLPDRQVEEPTEADLVEALAALEAEDDGTA